MADFKADARIPSRPLSYEYVDQAVNKELIIDYSTGEVYIKDAEGNIINLTFKIAEIVMEKIGEDPDVINQFFQITIINPETGEEEIIALTELVVNNYNKIIELEKNFNKFLEEFNEYKTVTDERLDTIEKDLYDPDTGLIVRVEKIEKDLYDPDTGLIARVEKLEQGGGPNIGDTFETDGNGNPRIPADWIEPDPDHRFVTDEQLNNINQIPKKCEISYKIVTIRTSDWQGTEAPYIATLTIPEITSDMRPTLDLICSSYYATSIKEEDAFCIYKGITEDGKVTLYNRVLPDVDLTVQFEIKTPTTVIA